jgi:hypothetical protein
LCLAYKKQVSLIKETYLKNQKTGCGFSLKKDIFYLKQKIKRYKIVKIKELDSSSKTKMGH